MKYIEELAAQKKTDPQELKDKMINCGAPGTSGTTVAFPTLHRCWVVINFYFAASY